MAFPVVASSSLRRIAQYFGRGAEAIRWQVGQGIRPVFIVGSAPFRQAVGQANGDLTPGAGTYVPYFTVPRGERWHILVIRRFSSTGNTAIAASVNSVVCYLTPTGTSADPILYSFELGEGDSIGMVTTGNGGDGAISLHLFYEVEEVDPSLPIH